MRRSQRSYDLTQTMESTSRPKFTQSSPIDIPSTRTRQQRVRSFETFNESCICCEYEN